MFRLLHKLDVSAARSRHSEQMCISWRGVAHLGAAASYASGDVQWRKISTRISGGREWIDRRGFLRLSQRENRGTPTVLRCFCERYHF
jgi:hypothetical protein